MSSPNLNNKNIGNYTYQAGGLIDSNYVEIYSSTTDSNVAHIYKDLSNPSVCDREGGVIAQYIDAWEFHEIPSWKESLEKQFGKDLSKKFQFLGPPLFKVVHKINQARPKWEGFPSRELFSPPHVKAKFYKDMLKSPVDSAIAEVEIRNRILKVVNKHLKDLQYGVYHDMGELRLCFDGRLSTYDTIDSLRITESFISTAKNRTAYAGSELLTLYNRDRVNRGLDRISKKVEPLEQKSQTAVSSKSSQLTQMMEALQKTNQTQVQQQSNRSKLIKEDTSSSSSSDSESINSPIIQIKKMPNKLLHPVTQMDMRQLSSQIQQDRAFLQEKQSRGYDEYMSALLNLQKKYEEKIDVYSSSSKERFVKEIYDQILQENDKFMDQNKKEGRLDPVSVEKIGSKEVYSLLKLKDSYLKRIIKIIRVNMYEKTVERWSLTSDIREINKLLDKNAALQQIKYYSIPYDPTPHFTRYTINPEQEVSVVKSDLKGTFHTKPIKQEKVEPVKILSSSIQDKSASSFSKFTVTPHQDSSLAKHALKGKVVQITRHTINPEQEVSVVKSDLKGTFHTKPIKQEKVEPVKILSASMPDKSASSFSKLTVTPHQDSSLAKHALKGKVVQNLALTPPRKAPVPRYPKK